MAAQLSNVAIDISKHPLIKQAYEVCQAIEKCGASPELTDAVTKASALMQGIANVMEREPVAWTDEQELRDLEKSGCACLFTVNPITPNADARRVIRLYTAPPAPVAVPDEMPKSAYEILSKAMGAKACFISDDLWNACRAAMLKGEK